MITFRTDRASPDEIRRAIARPLADVPLEVEERVRAIVQSVRSRGDAALLEYTRIYDCPTVASVEVPRERIEGASRLVDTRTLDALRSAASRIQAFHRNQLPNSWWMTTCDGGLAGQMVAPLNVVGVYVPGGKAIYPSSVLMNCVPARSAGVEEVVICVPPLRSGEVAPEVLATAAIAGVSRVFAIGGAQAIAAMAFGTETVPRVDKIVGPGNIYVTLAKRMVWGEVGLDMPAGPSEVCIVADETAVPSFVASDLLAQVEHADDCRAFLVTTSERAASETLAELNRQTSLHPRRDTLAAAMRNAVTILAPTLGEAIAWANEIAPEHLSLCVAEPMLWLPKVRCAGAVLLGNHTPQSLGDYAAGPSHTLPTNGAGRFASPLSVDDFVKKTSVIYYDANSLSGACGVIETLGAAEGFDAHVYAARIRGEYSDG